MGNLEYRFCRIVAHIKYLQSRNIMLREICFVMVLKGPMNSSSHVVNKYSFQPFEQL